MQTKIDYLKRENDDLKFRVSELEELVKLKNEALQLQ